MAWVLLTEAGLKASLHDDEVQKWREFVGESGTDPVPEILSRTTAEVRGYLVNKYRLALTGIPASLANDAYDIAIYRLTKRVESQSALQRKDAADDARKKLEAIARCEIGVEDATVDGVFEAERGGVEVASFSERIVTRDTMQGI